MTTYYPMLVNLEGERCLIVGGGEVAARKVRNLLAYKPDIVVVSPQICRKLKELQGQGRITLKQRKFVANDLQGAKVAFAATNDQKLNQRIAHLAQKRNIPVNVVDSLELSTFIVPSIIRRGAFQLAISTNGQFPALAKKTRQQLETTFDSAFEQYLVLLNELRKTVFARFSSKEKRKRMLVKLLHANLLETLRRNGLEQARKKARELLKSD